MEFILARIQILHVLNELHLRNSWIDQDQFAIRVARRLAATGLPANSSGFENEIRGVKTGFFKLNQMSRQDYCRRVWPQFSIVAQSVGLPGVPNVGTRPISSEAELFQSVVKVLNRYKDEVEATRLWEPFWNQKGSEPTDPKSEPSLQPTIRSQLRHRFNQIGVEFIRESNDGAGSLDFRCVHTRLDEVFNCCVEFKRAQHDKLEHGIMAQLPAYMDAADTKCGVLFVFWFKDGIHCNDPRGYDGPNALRSHLLTSVNRSAGRSVDIIVVDVTPGRPSASRRWTTIPKT